MATKERQDVEPPRPRRMCVYCQELTDRPVFVDAVEQGTGPGWAVYACPSCAHRFRPDFAARESERRR
ncbi:hypothetical protein H3146_26820 [Streptomyces sp. OF3]|uniref:Uncharacterized protein n=1 Tax=Streptomyces alkaliterrae TaxID=2213162 RepID=A0A7W3WRH2_9ACTN|nr:hypothetical protein [Streptomyces alkaliterrae]MBB1256925.1 hypothetical protein [Streptomyces alkaliterrae]